jgi:ribosomal protein L11 methyltransferase
MIDWEEQWRTFAHNFYEGKAHIDIRGKTLLLKPGAGFGDLSHPTTALMLEMMESHVPDQSVIDIGTGSGILALASLLLGARSAHGIDIDSAAIAHAKENNKLNHLKATFSKKIPQNPDAIYLMNMIVSEQREVKRPQGKLWITSGILSEQKESYLQQTEEWGWRPILIHEKAGWAGFIFR